MISGKLISQELIRDFVKSLIRRISERAVKWRNSEPVRLVNAPGPKDQFSARNRSNRRTCGKFVPPSA